MQFASADFNKNSIDSNENAKRFEIFSKKLRLEIEDIRNHLKEESSLRSFLPWESINFSDGWIKYNRKLLSNEDLKKMEEISNK